jgi:hypothetical protein
MHPGLPQLLVLAQPLRKWLIMKQNEGTIDRAIRVVLGVVLLSLTVIGPRTWLGFIGFVPLLTGLVGFCPLYGLIGVRTCSPIKKPLTVIK